MTEVAVNRALGRMAPAEMQRMKIAVARMAKKLATRQARRQRQKLRGQLDVRRTMRANAGHDGVPFRTRFQAPPASQTKDRRDLRYVEIGGFAGALPPDVSLRFARRGG